MKEIFPQAERDEINEREQALDGVCKHVHHFNIFPEHLIKRCFPAHWIANKGKTRAVIEYDNDTGKGWIRIVTEYQSFDHPSRSKGSQDWGLSASQAPHPVACE